MNQPERVGLYFPRSGQQLYVYVSPELAATVSSCKRDTVARPLETCSGSSSALRLKRAEDPQANA